MEYQMKKNTLTSKLTKSQKFMIIFWGLYELIMGIIAADERHGPFRLFLILSIPCILYWAGVWIWGFGYLLKFLKKCLVLFRNKKCKKIVIILLFIFLLSFVLFYFGRSYKKDLIPVDLSDDLVVQNHLGNNNELSKYLYNKETESIGYAISFFEGIKMLNVFCAENDYIPYKYINNMLEYKRRNDLDAEIISVWMKDGKTKEQAIYDLKELYKLIHKELLSNGNYRKLYINDYLIKKEENPNLTKKQYCRDYDLHTDIIIKAQIENIKKKYPHVYKNIF